MPQLINRNPERQPQTMMRLFWAAVFCYPILTGLLIQLVLLPYVFPAWHAGDGILIGGDWYSFHMGAVRLSEAIRAEGWQAWVPAPGGQIVSGIAAIFYTLITPKPWTLLPLNAALHTVATWALFDILRNITGDWKKALIGAIPFAVFPSALTWTAQMHNDGYAIPGGMLFISGWVSLARQQSWQKAWIVARSVALILAGAWLMWLVRPYMVTMMRGLAGIASLGLAVVFIRSSIRKQLSWWKTTAAVLIFLALSFASFGQTEFSSGSGGRSTPPTWERSPWLPGYIDRQLRALSRTRSDVIIKWQSGASNIDTDVSFKNAAELIRYAPRAVQIGFLSPFPADWFGTGSKAPNTMMRRISGVEMIFIYAALLCLPYALWHWRGRAEMWVLLFFCTGMILIYVYGVPNVGTLYRFRYAYIMSVAGLGVAGGYALYEQFRVHLHKGSLGESTPVR